jgi:hypothetical protein
MLLLTCSDASRFGSVYYVPNIFQILHILQGGSVPPASNSRLSPLSHEPAGFYNVDIPMDSTKVLSFYKFLFTPVFTLFSCCNWIDALFAIFMVKFVCVIKYL